MKKLLKMGICIMMAAVVLSGCGGGSSKTETAVYEGEINGAKVSNTIDYSGDRVLKQTSVSEMNFKNSGIQKEVVEQISSVNYRTQVYNFFQQFYAFIDDRSNIKALKNARDEMEIWEILQQSGITA